MADVIAWCHLCEKPMRRAGSSEDEREMCADCVEIWAAMTAPVIDVERDVAAEPPQ